MIRLPALLLAGCVVSAGLILLGRGSDSPLFERSPPATEIKTGAQAREIAEPLHGPTQRASQTASSDSHSDLGPPDVRLSGIVIEPDRRIAIFAVNGTKAVVLSEGEALKDWRIDSISPQEVSLSGPAGTMTLKPKSDANLVRPAPPAAAPAGHSQPDIPPRFFRSFPMAFPAPAGAPEQPTAATLIADESAPAAVAPYGYDDYSLPYYAYGAPVGIGFRSFHQPGFHHAGFRRGFRSGGFHGGFPGGHFHSGFRSGGGRGGGGGHGGHR